MNTRFQIIFFFVAVAAFAGTTTAFLDFQPFNWSSGGAYHVKCTMHSVVQLLNSATTEPVAITIWPSEQIAVIDLNSTAYYIFPDRAYYYLPFINASVCYDIAGMNYSVFNNGYGYQRYNGFYRGRHYFSGFAKDPGGACTPVATTMQLDPGNSHLLRWDSAQYYPILKEFFAPFGITITTPEQTLVSLYVTCPHKSRAPKWSDVALPTPCMQPNLPDHDTETFHKFGWCINGTQIPETF